MKNMSNYLAYLEKYLKFEEGRIRKLSPKDDDWKARHVCCCEVKEMMKDKFKELHEAFKPVAFRAGLAGCSPNEWPSCASETKVLSVRKKK